MEEQIPRLRPGTSFGALMTFMLTAMFAVLTLLIVIAGARVYRTVEDGTTRNYNTRTAAAYVAGRVRSADEAGVIGAMEADGIPVLLLGREIAGKRYCTYIFCKDGELLEYFGSAERAFDPVFGEAVAPMQSFVPQLDGARLTLTMTDMDGRSRTLRLYLTAGEAGA